MDPMTTAQKKIMVKMQTSKLLPREKLEAML
jgi:hypothetical protein